MVRSPLWLAFAGAILLFPGCEDSRNIRGRTPDDVTDDKRLEAKIGMMFLEDPVLRTRKIKIDVLNGKVILTGVVYTPEEKAKATELPKYVGVGGGDITNKLEVRPPE